MPLRDSASAVPSPPMPPPTTSTGARLSLAVIRCSQTLTQLSRHSRIAAAARSSECPIPSRREMHDTARKEHDAEGRPAMTRLLGALLALGFLGAGAAAAQTAYPSQT